MCSAASEWCLLSRSPRLTPTLPCFRVRSLCVRLRLLPPACGSLVYSCDCPIFYKRKKIQKDLQDTQESLDRFQW